MELIAKDIHLSYGGKLVLSHVQLSCKQGELIGIIGKYHSGKSALLRAIYGVEKADHQTILVAGQRRDRLFLEPHLMRFVPESFQFMGYMTIQRALASFNVSNHQAEILALLGPGTRLNSRLHHLTNGTRKLLEIIVLLYTRPAFLLIDEPMTVLDRGLREKLDAAISRNQLQTGLLVTYGPGQETLAGTKRIYELGGGYLVNVEKEQNIGNDQSHSPGI